MGGKVGSKVSALLGAALLFAGCTDSGAEPAPTGEPDDGGGLLDSSTPRDAGKDAGDGSGDGGQDASASAEASAEAGSDNGPTVEVLAPVATTDPNSTDVVIGNSVKVRCSATKNSKSERVDPASIKVALYQPGSSKAIATQTASSTSDTGVFEADLSLADAPHGSIRIECQGSDLATQPAQTLTSITTLYDRGPEITFLNPTTGGFVAAGTGLGEDVRVRFKATARPLATGDTGGAIQDLTVTVGGKPKTGIEKSTTEADVYSFGLDFADSSFFTIVPDTLSLRVTATTARLTQANAVTAALAVGVDSEGPLIVVRAPAPILNQLPVVSGKVDIILEVTDKLAGVEPSSIVVRIPKNAIPGNPTPGNDEYAAAATGTANQYAATFETGSYPDRSNLSITVVASDKVNNKSQSGFPVDVDTIPPWITLDPPTVREKSLQGNVWQCSGVFDPLGDAVNEGIIGGLGRAYRPRALIWDRPLEVANLTSRRYAMINNSTPRLYIQHNNDVKLLIDSDDDANNYCDKINDSANDVSKAPVTITLSPVTPAGTPNPAGDWVSVGMSNVFSVNLTQDPQDTAAPVCTTSIPATFGSPRPVAEDTSITRVIKHVVSGNYAAVYADSPTATGIRSTGKDYVAPGPGWACLVATAEDNAGNFGFSEPIRVCTETADSPPCSSLPPPDCTDGCVIPDQFLRSPSGPIKGMPRILQYSN